MLREMQPYEWLEWQVYLRRKPLLPDRMDRLFASMMKIFVDFSQTLDRTKYPDGVPIEEFYPAWMRAQGEQVALSKEASAAYVVEMALMLGAIDLRGMEGAG